VIISFDLDDTLFVDPDAVKTEKGLTFPSNLKFREKLRFGTIDLLKRMKNEDIKIWIYITSFRSEKYIKSSFKCYGIKIDEVINGERHNKDVQGYRKEPLPSKYPSKYRIDLHVDDDISVYQNGQIYGFKVFILKNDDLNWSNRLWEEIKKIKVRNTF
jgi:hypothetical protein